MSNLERLTEELRAMPEDLAGELLDFLAYAKARREREEMAEYERVKAVFDALPEDDEEPTPELLAALAAAEAETETISGEEVYRRAGLL